jgi:hypothetical protein
VGWGHVPERCAFRRPIRGVTDETHSSLFDEPLSLIVIGMFVAPIPVLRLRFVVLFVVLTISFMLFREISSVGAVFIVIPVVIVLVATVIDPNLNAGLLRCCGGDHWQRSRNGSS